MNNNVDNKRSNPLNDTKVYPNNKMQKNENSCIHCQKTNNPIVTIYNFLKYTKKAQKFLDI